MYSFEEKMKAVNLYIKYHRKAAPVIRELGYPERHMLVKWYKQYEATETLIHDHINVFDQFRFAVDKLFDDRAEILDCFDALHLKKSIKLGRFSGKRRSIAYTRIRLKLVSI